MNLKDKGMSKKTKKFSISTVLNISAVVVALFGIALLVTNIVIFRLTVNQYVAQGYSSSDVLKGLLPSLLPQIFEPIAVYGGIAIVLVGVAAANKKISKYLEFITEDGCCCESCEDITSETEGTEETAEVVESEETKETTETTETTEQSETIDKAE